MSAPAAAPPLVIAPLAPPAVSPQAAGAAAAAASPGASAATPEAQAASLKDAFETFTRSADALGRAYSALEARADAAFAELARLRAESADRERWATLGEAAGALAHQVRNPLNGFQGFLGLLMRELADLPASSNARLYASKALEGARELEKVVAGILDLAKPETLEKAPVAVAQVIGDAVAEVAVSRSVARVSVDVPRSITANVDAVRIKRAVANLVANALEATPEPGRVRVRARRRDASVVIEVEDEGPGIAPELRPRLFRPFATTRARGAGLGLATVRKIALLHGGTASALDLTPHGARFSIELP